MRDQALQVGGRIGLRDDDGGCWYRCSLRRYLFTKAAEQGWPLAVCALLVYGFCTSPHIVDGDNAEFSTLSAIGGRAHPSGYPLYVLWLRVWSWLPCSSPARGAAIATAILGALAIGTLHAACRAWGARPLAATVSVAIAGSAPLVLRYHTEAEAFAMNHLVAGLVLWLAAEHGPLRGRWRGVALGLVAGAGLSNHLTCALLAPIGLLGVVRAARESSAATYAIAACGFVLGLCPYLYLPFADGPASWGTVATPSDLLAFVLRNEFGGTFNFLVNGAESAGAANVVALFSSMLRSWLWLPAAAGTGVLVYRIWRPMGESRAAWALLLASLVLAGPVLASRFNLAPVDLGLYVCERFHLLPVLLLAVPVAAALDPLCARVSRVGMAASLAMVGFIALSVAGMPRLSRTHSPAMERGVQNLLRSLPRDAIVVVTADDHCFGGRYLQLTRAERPDVSLVCSGLMLARWYRASWAGRGLEMPSATGPSLGNALLHTGRPVFVDPNLTTIVAAYPNYPFGIVMRLLPPGAARPSAGEVAAINRDVYRAFDVEYPRPQREDEYAAMAHHRYAATWAAIARLLDAEGDRSAARDAFELTQLFKPVDE